MTKLLSIVALFVLMTLDMVATPPKPATFVENRGIEPSLELIKYMKSDISGEVERVIYVWNDTYENPSEQIAELITIFRTLSDSPKLAKQLLLNKKFELYRVLHTEVIVRALDRFQNDINRAYRALFNYSSVIIGTQDGSMIKRYDIMVKSMKIMVDSYNHLVKVTNSEYKKRYLPYYKLNYKR